MGNQAAASDIAGFHGSNSGRYSAFGNEGTSVIVMACGYSILDALVEESVAIVFVIDDLALLGCYFLQLIPVILEVDASEASESSLLYTLFNKEIKGVAGVYP